MDGALPPRGLFRVRISVTFGKSQAEVYQECLRRQLPLDAIYVGRMEADPNGVPPWGTVEADWSLYEITNAQDPGLPRTAE